MTLEIEKTGMKTILRKCPLDQDGMMQGAPVDAYGVIRLWGDAPKIPSDLYIFLGDFPDLDEKKIEALDEYSFDVKIDEIFKHANVKIEDYGEIKGRAYHMDIVLPNEVVDKYSKLFDVRVKK